MKPIYGLLIVVALAVIVALNMPQRSPGADNTDYELQQCVREVAPRLRATRDNWQAEAVRVCEVGRKVARERR